MAAWLLKAKQITVSPGGAYLRSHSETYNDLFDYLSKLSDADKPLNIERQLTLQEPKK